MAETLPITLILKTIKKKTEKFNFAAYEWIGMSRLTCDLIVVK